MVEVNFYFNKFILPLLSILFFVVVFVFLLVYYKKDMPARKPYLIIFSVILFMIGLQSCTYLRNNGLLLSCSEKGLSYSIFFVDFSIPWNAIETAYIYDRKVTTRACISQPILCIVLNQQLSSLQSNFFVKMVATIYGLLMRINLIWDDIKYDSSKIVLIFSFVLDESIDKILKVIKDNRQ